jgi:hypothetical protein
MELKRVHLMEWLAGFAGLIILIGLGLPWSGDNSGFESFSLLKLILELLAVAAVLIPVVVALSSKTDLPMVWELFTSIAAVIAVLILIARLIFPPDAGLGSGFFVVLGGAILLCAGGWRSVARES